MMIKYISILYLFVSTSARPNGDVNTQNVVTVPPNCPSGQEWVNGQCRDVWKSVTAEPSNVVTVPTNCPAGQEYVNGQCRDVWYKENLGVADINYAVDSHNVVTVPPNCPPGQQWINGQCRDVWRILTDINPIVDSHNVVTVPPNCPTGQQWINGQCRDVWRMSSNVLDNFINNIKETLTRNERQIENIDAFIKSNDSLNKNVISVPNQCPSGYKPDTLGVCRPILF